MGQFEFKGNSMDSGYLQICGADPITLTTPDAEGVDRSKKWLKRVYHAICRMFYLLANLKTTVLHVPALSPCAVKVRFVLRTTGALNPIMSSFERNKKSCVFTQPFYPIYWSGVGVGVGGGGGYQTEHGVDC